MKRYILLLFCAVLPFCAMAQNTRVINGVVISEDDVRLAGVRILVDGRASDISTDQNGSFSITVPVSAKKLSVIVNGYLPQAADIDGTVLVFRLEYDKGSAQYAEKKAKEKKVRDTNFEKKFKTSGLVHSIDFSYGYQLSKGEVIYKNLGYRDYGDLSPLSLTYSIGWRFNNFISLSAGAGVLYYLRSLEIPGESFGSYYEGWSPRRVDVPVFLNARMYLSKTMVQPLISLSGGIYVLSKTPMLDLGVGVSVRVTKGSSVNVMAVFGTTPWYSIAEEGISHKMSLTPGIKLGYSF